MQNKGILNRTEESQENSSTSIYKRFSTLKPKLDNKELSEVQQEY